MSVSVGGDVAADILKELRSFNECRPFKPESPAVGILRFFLLLVFSNESYPSMEDVVEGGG